MRVVDASGVYEEVIVDGDGDDDNVGYIYGAKE